MEGSSPLVSVIIPTRNSAESLGGSLESIKNQSYKNPELIVVDNNSTDDTKEIAKKYTDEVFNSGPECSAQRNFGAKQAKGVKKTTIKIAFFSVGFLEGGGGLAKYFIETSTGLMRLFPHLEISIVTLDKNFDRKLRILLSAYYFKNLTKGENAVETTENIIDLLGNVRYIRNSSMDTLRRELKKYDVIYSKNEILEAFVLKYFIGYKNLPPIIFGCHTPIYYPVTKSFQARLHNLLYDSFIYRYLTSGVKTFHVINSTDEVRLSKLLPRRLVIKIYIPFDFSLYFTKTTLPKYIINKNSTNILWVGRLTEQKGVNDLVEIINLINKSGYAEKIIWNICGDGPEKDKILSLKTWQNVHYLGYVESKYMPEIYKQSSLFISTSHWEGFPYNLLEAQGASLPVLAYNISGCNDIIDDQINGILVENVSQFKNEVVNFVDGKYQFCDIREYISKKFNQALIYEQLLDLISSVAKKSVKNII